MRRVSPRGYNIRNSARINRYSPPKRVSRASDIFAGNVCTRNFRLFPLPLPFLPRLRSSDTRCTVAVCGCHAIRTHNNAIPRELRKHSYLPLPKSQPAVSLLFPSRRPRHARYALPNISKQPGAGFQQACSSSRHDFRAVISLPGAIGRLNYPFPTR